MAWVAVETFDSYSDAADLNGQNGGSGWSAAWTEGGTTGIVVDAAVTYDGGKSIKSTSATVGTGNNFRQLSTDLTGDGNVFYCAMRRSANNSGSHRINIRNTSDSGRVDLWMDADSNIYLKGLPSGTQRTLVSGYSVDTWYVFKVTLNTSSGTVTAAVSTDAYGTAGTFGADSSSSAFTSGDIRYILVDADPDGAGSGATMYWDYFSGTSPFTSSAPVNAIMFGHFA